MAGFGSEDMGDEAQPPSKTGGFDRELSESDGHPSDQLDSSGGESSSVLERSEGPSENRPGQWVVRCGSMRMLCLLSSRQKFLHGTRVICKTPRGTELGEVLCEATPQVIATLEDPPSGVILRRVTATDEAELNRQRDTSVLFESCQREIKTLGLKMQLVDVERLFGGERVVVYYLADERVDFRQLVRQLIDEFKTRVEMRQIGVRDEAKLLADYGDCGKPVCCNTYLTQMPPVSMKMAKLQKATLDPAKISGRCGRLKCCLRYEYDTYEEMRRELPPIGSRVVLQCGNATVLNQEILSQQLLVQTEDNRRILVAASEVLSVSRRSGGKRGNSEQGPSAPEDSSSPESES